MSVRVRFAPSPTGLLHVGALRTALFDHLFAKKHGGVDILRLEDTDRSRFNPDSESEFIESLSFVGIEFDEGPHAGGNFGPYRQSERKAAGLYEPWIAKIMELGAAYKAFETPEELEEMRNVQSANKAQVGYYGGAWRDATPEQVAEAEAAGMPYVIRQRIPRNRTVTMQDPIRGSISWETNLLDDPVLIKADGMPTYHFASMVDDRLMEITHVIRGEEWLSSAPKHLLLLETFGWPAPVILHCPVIVGNDGKKLSKRHGATRVLDYIAEGYLPDALLNFVALIGWSPGDEREDMTMDEMIQAFSLEGLQPSPGRFDIEKLRWLNGAKIRAMEPSVLLAALLSYINRPATMQFWSEKEQEENQPSPTAVRDALLLFARTAIRDRAYALDIVKLEQERVTTLADFGLAGHFFLVDEPEMDPKAVSKWFTQPHVGELFNYLLERLTAPRAPVGGPVDYEHASVEWCEALIRGYAEDKGFEKLGPVVHPTRVALTGKTTGPGLFELMAALGPDRMVARLQRAKALL